MQRYAGSCRYSKMAPRRHAAELRIRESNSRIHGFADYRSADSRIRGGHSRIHGECPWGLFELPAGVYGYRAYRFWFKVQGSWFRV